MKYVKIKAKSYNDALMDLRMKYGDDAIPISHKYVKEGGLFNTPLFAKEMVELTAAYNEKGGAPRSKSSSAAPQASAASTRKTGIDLRADGDVTRSLLAGAEADDAPALEGARAGAGVYGRNGRQIAPPAEEPRRAEAVRTAQSAINASQAASKSAPGDIVLTRDEYNSLKKFEKDFRDIKDSLERLKAQKTDEAQGAVRLTEEDELLKPCAEMLRKNDFDEERSRGMLEQMKSSMSRDDMRDRVKIDKTLKELLKSRIVVAPEIKNSVKRRAIMFVGPTGVGKTTSLAKLGAIYALREGKSVAFVTIDTYRIAATEQLKKYADIMRIPVHVVNDQKEFRAVMEKEKADVVLIDTSGRSHKNTLKIAEIKSYAENADCEVEKILCISASTKKADAESVFSAFGKLEFNSVMITKTDESNYIGNIIDIADIYNKPISYITNGQEVPNDIMTADADRIADMMMGSIRV